MVALLIMISSSMVTVMVQHDSDILFIIVVETFFFTQGFAVKQLTIHFF